MALRLGAAGGARELHCAPVRGCSTASCELRRLRRTDPGDGCRMSRTWPENEFGPDFEFREYSFLDNAQAGPLKAATLTLEVCQVCMGRWRPAHEGAVRL